MGYGQLGITCMRLVLRCCDIAPPDPTDGTTNGVCRLFLHPAHGWIMAFGDECARARKKGATVKLHIRQSANHP